MRECLPISTASVGGIRWLFFQISRINTSLMGYWIAGKVRNVMRSVMFKSDLRRGENILRGVLMIPCAVFLRPHFRSGRIIDIPGSGRGIVDGLVCVL